MSIPSGHAETPPTALAIAHPGHELRLLKWIEQTRPSVFILTSGSRSGTSRSRVEASRGLAQELGATPGEVFGGRLDREVYDWILAGDPTPFRDLARQLADSFVARGIGRVVTDSWQFYNAVHDLWHVTVRLAAEDAAARMGHPVEVLDYPVVPAAMGVCRPGPERLRLTLTPAEVARKLRLAHAFPEIADDLAEVIAAGGPEVLALETLHDPLPLRDLRPAPGETPLYEQYGEARVAGGLYASVLRWTHVEPIALALAAVVV